MTDRTAPCFEIIRSALTWNNDVGENHASATAWSNRFERALQIVD